MNRARPRTPRDPRMTDAWWASAAAYRKAYGEHHDPHRGSAQEAYGAAIAALHKVVPDLSEREAMLEAVAEVSYASQMHPKWLYALHRPEPRKN